MTSRGACERTLLAPRSTRCSIPSTSILTKVGIPKRSASQSRVTVMTDSLSRAPLLWVEPKPEMKLDALPRFAMLS